MTGFDSFGRLAFGQITRPLSTSKTITGVAAAGTAGLLRDRIDVGSVVGVSCIGAVGNGSKTIAKGIVGVNGNGNVGLLRDKVDRGITGVSGAGVAALLLPWVAKTINGVAATGFAGTTSDKVAGGITGVAGVGLPGSMIPGVSAFIQGVAATGYLGDVMAVHSGGGVSRVPEAVQRQRHNRKMGMEPVKKVPHRPEPPKPPKVLLPPFPDLPPPLVPQIGLPDELVDKRMLPPDRLGLRDEIYSAQDLSDISDLLLVLDNLD